MSSSCITRLATLGIGLGLLLPASIAVPSSSTLAGDDARVSVQSSHAERLAYAGQKGRRMSDIGVRNRAATSDSGFARYDTLNQAWRAIRSDWTRLKASTSTDWRLAKNDLEHDWTALVDQWQRLTSN